MINNNFTIYSDIRNLLFNVFINLLSISYNKALNKCKTPGQITCYISTYNKLSANQVEQYATPLKVRMGKLVIPTTIINNKYIIEGLAYHDELISKIKY